MALMMSKYLTYVQLQKCSLAITLLQHTPLFYHSLLKDQVFPVYKVDCNDMHIKMFW